MFIRSIVMLVAAIALSSSDAHAELLTYESALEAAVNANPALVNVRYDYDSAVAGVTAAKGIFDTNLTLNTGNFRYRDTNYDQEFGIQLKNDVAGWNSGARLSAETPTGTTLSAGTDMSVITYSESESLFGVYENDQDTFSSGFDLSLNQDLLRGFKRSYNIQNVTRAKNTLTNAEISLRQIEQQTLANTADAYWGWVYAGQLQAISTDSVSVSEEALRVATLRVESGELAPIEKTRQEADLVQKQAEHIDAEKELRTAADTLLLLMGIAPGNDIIPATDIGDVPNLQIEVDDAVRVAMAQNFDVALARLTRDQADQELTWAKHETLPSLTASATYGLGDQRDEFGAAIGGLPGDVSDASWSLGATMVVPLMNRVAKGGRDQALASLHKAEVSLLELERTTASSVAAQVLTLNSALRKVSLADLQFQLAQETLAAEEALSEVGRIIQKDLLESRNAADSARVSAVKARIDYRLAMVALLRLQGQLTTKEAMLK
jgi:outer membrane protein